MAIRMEASDRTAPEQHWSAGRRGRDRRTGAAESPAWRSALATAAGPAVLALVLCCYGIGDRQLWRDEHASWWAAQLTWSQLGDLISHMDLVLAPYYALLHLWTGVFGDSEAALRLPSAFAVTGAAAGVALLGRRLFNPRLGVLAGLLFAVCPAITWYGQDARPYAFAVLAAVLSTLTLVRMVQSPLVDPASLPVRPGRPTWWHGPTVRSWTGYTLSVVGMGLTHLVTLSLLAGHLTLVLSTANRGRQRRLRWVLPRRWAVATGAALLLLSPGVILGARQSGQIAWNTKDWHDLGELPGKLAGSGTLGWSMLVVGLLGLVGLLALRQPVGLLACWVLLPVAATAATASWLHLFLDRYLLFTVPGWALLCAAAVGRVPGLVSPLTASRTPPRILSGVLPLVLVFLAAAAVSWPAQSTVRNDLGWEQDTRGAAGVISAGLRPGDGMIFEPGTSTRRAIAYELRGKPAPKDILMQRTPQQAKGFGAIECYDPTPCMAGVQRIWVLVGSNDGRPWGAITDKVQKELRQFHTVSTTRLPNLRVILVQRNAAPAKPPAKGGPAKGGPVKGGPAKAEQPAEH
ncbi:glycosyltransferase family 39 protein [Kitasatospora sp. RB6PN24]|uniref:glycosyltransferase family 39 protein n=1 Tax=Kitasatospora humi TaxID=2893891 RepID=UPI001E2AFD4E|nr:glycosyltransferase family 39 protein [Kitasatospora humi]MCC9309633.1 glycosyltransferase family 39 protein [Kitasatospora humi]